jgi:hypothetical protein
MPSTNIRTFVSSLYQYFDTRSIEVFWVSSHPPTHLVGHRPRLWTSFREFLGPIMNRFTLQTLPTVHRKHFFMNILRTELFCPQENTALRQYTRQTLWPFWLLKPAREHARLLPRLLWRWTGHRKFITSITAVLHPFMTYLLTVPHTFPFHIPIYQCIIHWHPIVRRLQLTSLSKLKER